MCGRFALRSPGRIKFDGARSSQLPLTPRFNIAPSQNVLVVTESQKGRELSSLVWGLVPSWSKDAKGFINARAETLEDKPSFSESFQKRRCLIPADGFYEWKGKGKSKQPYFFQLKDEGPFAFAGIWDEWQNNGDTIISCAIITTTPNELLATIHDRMPVILSAEDHESWLREDTAPAELRELLVPFSASEMQSFPVSSQVNYAQEDEAEMVERVELREVPTTGFLF